MQENTPATTGGAHDLALVRSALERRREALAALLVRLRCVPRMIVAHNRKLGRPLSGEAIEDVVQDVLMAVWRKLERFEGKATLETWIYPFCTFEFLRRVRFERSRRSLGELPSEAELEGDPAPGSAFEFEPLLRALEDLEPQEAEIVRLKHFEDRTFESIAECLGISPNTAKTRYYRGLQHLRVRLGRQHRTREGPHPIGGRAS